MTENAWERAKSSARTAEQQMRRWSLGLEIGERVEQDRAVSELSTQIRPYVAISRQAGAGGGAVAQAVAAELGWELVGKTLLHQMADRYKLPQDMLEFVDEKTSNWLLEVFGKWISDRVVTQSEYVVHLGQLVLLAAQHASTVFVGRGAQFLLPRDKGLAVAIIAPLEQRISRTIQQRSLDRDQAVKYIKEVDEGRRDFVRRYFHHDVAEQDIFDLVINLDQLVQEDAVDLIVACCQKRFGPESAA
jgi:cytidylate kinase